MTDRRSPRFVLVPLLGTLLMAAAIPASAKDGEADRLLGRVPPDASMALVVEDLGDHLRAIAESPAVRGIFEMAPVRDWLDSDEGAALRRARRDVEAALAAPLDEIADGLLGRAVVLSLHLPDDAEPDQARGMLQTVVADRDLLERFIAVANAAERGSGALRELEVAQHGGLEYSVRRFGDGRPDEAYLLLDDDSFIWTNSESLMRSALDRVADDDVPGLADEPAIARVLEELPEGAIASVLLDPGFLGRLAEADPDTGPIDELPDPLAEYLGAIDAVGAALRWREGPVLDVVEVLDPARLPAPVRSWASRGGDASALLPKIPASAVLAAAGHVDAASLHDLLIASVPEEERGRVDVLVEMLRGLLLGRDVRSEILPELGPGVVGWVGPPAEGRPVRESPAVLVVSVGDPGVAEAIENAARTALAFLSLDEDRDPPLRLARHRRDGARIVSVEAGEGPGSTRLAFAVGRGLIVVGNDVDAIAEALADPSADPGGPAPAALDARDRLFPEATSFAYLDLAALRRLAEDRRGDLERLIATRRPDDDDRSIGDDLDLVLVVAKLFRGAYVASSLAPDATIARRRVGLIVED